jgi:hypothetical protein
MNQMITLICIVVEMFLIIIITAISDIIIPHGSALFSKMASMDPLRPFSVSSPPLIQAPQSLAIHIPSLQGREKSIIITI